jgi:hypothetical protein
MKLSLLLATVTLLASCGGLPLDPARSAATLQGSELVVGEFRIRLALDPAVVERTEAFTARLQITNTSTRPAVWTSGYGCIAMLDVFRGEERIPLIGTDFGCIAATGSWPIAAGATLEADWFVHASRKDGLPVPTGEYLFVANLAPHRLEHRLTVR